MRKKGLLLMAVCMMVAGVLAGCGASSQTPADTTQETQLTTEEDTTTEDTVAETEQSETEETDTTAAETDGEDTSAEGGKTLVVYYSASGNTERVAEWEAACGI